MVYVSLENLTQALSSFSTRIHSNIIRTWQHLSQCLFSNNLLASYEISSPIYFLCKSSILLFSPYHHHGLGRGRPYPFGETPNVHGVTIFTQCCTSSAFLCAVETDTPIDISKELNDQSSINSVIKITSHSKGLERSISSRASHRSRPDRYAFYFDIHTDSLPFLIYLDYFHKCPIIYLIISKI